MRAILTLITAMLTLAPLKSLAQGSFLSPSPSPSAEEKAPQAELQQPQSTPSFVASSNYNIRTADGNRLCVVKKGTPLIPQRLNSDGDFAQVNIQAPGCPSTGWISINGLKSESKDGTSNMQVDVDGSLSLRSKPAGKWNCGLPPQTAVTVIESPLGNSQYRMWSKVRVSNPPAGCPNEGWVHSEYLRPSNDMLKELPRDEKPAETVVSDDNDDKTEAIAEVPCKNCSPKISTDNLRDVAKDTLRFSDISKWKKSRGLVQIPTRGSTGNIGPCGSFHYSPDRVAGHAVDNYANPLTACVMMSALQDWKKKCPSGQAGCRVSWGDISHKTKSKFNTHKTHTDGHCMDIRPMRKGGFENSPMTWKNGDYDRAATTKFIKLLRDKGATTLIFNDPKIRAGRAGGHNNHIHVCFKPTATTKAVCDNYKYDANTCGGN